MEPFDRAAPNLASFHISIFAWWTLPLASQSLEYRLRGSAPRARIWTQ